MTLIFCFHANQLCEPKLGKVRFQTTIPSVLLAFGACACACACVLLLLLLFLRIVNTFFLTDVPGTTNLEKPKSRLVVFTKKIAADQTPTDCIQSCYFAHIP